MITEIHKATTEVFDRVSRGLRRLASEPITKAPEFVREPDGKGSMFLFRDGYQVERLAPAERNRRGHVFADVRSFAGWLLRHGDPRLVEVLVRGQSIDAALEPMSVDGDVVGCHMAMHPRFERWSNVFGRKLTQDEIHRFFLSVGEDTQPVKSQGGELIGTQADMIAGELRKLEISSEGSFKREIDERGMIRFSASDETTNVSGKLPSSFKIRVPVYRGICEIFNTQDDQITDIEKEYNITVRLFVHARKGQEPTFELSAPGLPVTIDTATEDAVTFLGALLGEEWLVGRGVLTLHKTPDRHA